MPDTHGGSFTTRAMQLPGMRRLIYASRMEEFSARSEHSVLSPFGDVRLSIRIDLKQWWLRVFGARIRCDFSAIP